MAFKKSVESGSVYNTESFYGRIAAVEECIIKLASVKDSLQQNSTTLKAEIQEHVSLLLSHLRQREVQLLRQVDALISHQNSLVQVQLAKLYQMLGIYQTAMSYLKQGNCLTSFDIDQDAYNKAIKLASFQKLKFQAQGNEVLHSAIQNFGRVEASGDGGVVGMFMLPDEDDYGDGDHHILYKSLQDGKKPEVKICFPTLSLGKEDWLQIKTKEETSSQDFDFELINVPCKSGSVSPKSSCTSSPSESIEVIPVDNKSSEWLTKSSVVKNISSCCRWQNFSEIEIENLDELSCTSNNQSSKIFQNPSTSEWLQKTSNQGISFSLPSLRMFDCPLVLPVGEVCKANEKCSSFINCLCDENCMVSNLKEQLKSVNIDNENPNYQGKINQAINEVIQSQSKNALENSMDTWLSPKPTTAHNVAYERFVHSNDNQQWLSPSSISCKSSVKENLQIKSDMLGSSENSMWLSGNCLEKIVTEKKIRTDEIGVESWLSHSQKSEFCKDTKTTDIIQDMFSDYFQPFDLKMWIKES